MNASARLKPVFRAAWNGPHRQVRFVSGLAAMGLMVLMLIDLLPSRADSLAARPDVRGPRRMADALSDEQVNALLELIQKRSLFKPAAPLPVRAMARDSVKRIRDSLSLHGILERDGEKLAYINVKGVGMKAYRMGNEEQGLFKVLRIQERSVEIEIVGERLELEL